MSSVEVKCRAGRRWSIYRPSAEFSFIFLSDESMLSAIIKHARISLHLDFRALTLSDIESNVCYRLGMILLLKCEWAWSRDKYRVKCRWLSLIIFEAIEYWPSSEEHAATKRAAVFLADTMPLSCVSHHGIEQNSPRPLYLHQSISRHGVVELNRQYWPWSMRKMKCEA